ncbi:MAG: YicC family protein [Coxiellaceae bacterium]|nr:MAG: YicC family protein [Coxiellaceae bacterium]
MIKSMTAFAHQAAQYPWGNLVWELRAVNHRYLEINIRLPENLREIEVNLREQLRSQLTRGKVECSLRYQSAQDVYAPLMINEAMVQELVKVTADLAQHFPAARPPTLTQILAWPGVVRSSDVDLQPIHSAALVLFQQALQSFQDARLQEGAALQGFITERLSQLRQITQQTKNRLPELLELQKNKLVARFEEASLSFDSGRLEQEMVVFAQKTDVAEELDRLVTHIEEVQRTLRTDGAVGRRLDFLMQELQREANTLASKALDVTTALAAVEMKVLIEQMREQIQNIE